MTHTKGPWQTMMYRDDGLVVVSQKGAYVAKCSGISAVIDSEDELKANARLIAAAPALLDACRAAYDGDGDWRALLEDAIAYAVRA
jgi:hypothetical protein